MSDLSISAPQVAKGLNMRETVLLTPQPIAPPDFDLHYRKESVSMIREDNVLDDGMPRIEHLLDEKQLVQLKALFDRAPGASLDEGAFAEVFQPIVGDRMSKAQLLRWIREIDANANGSVDWHEFSSHVLMSDQRGASASSVSRALLSREDAVSLGFLPGRTDAQVAAQASLRHTAPVSRILPLSNRVGGYLTAGWDGALKVWEPLTLLHAATLSSPINPPGHTAAAGIADAALFGRGSMVATVSTEGRWLDVYDIGAGRAIRRYYGTRGAQDDAGMPALPVVSLTGSRDGGGPAGTGYVAGIRGMPAATTSPLQCVLLKDLVSSPSCIATVRSDLAAIGNADGTVLAVPIHARAWKPSAKLFGTANAGAAGCLRPHGAVLPIVRATASWKFHTGSVSRIVPCPHLQSLASASFDGTVVLWNPDSAQPLRVITDTEAPGTAVFSVSWSDTYKVLATCGIQRYAMLWNPWHEAPVAKLGPHSASLLESVFNDSARQLITLDATHTVRVWDLRMNRLAQIFVAGSVKQGEGHSSLAFDERRSTVVAAGTSPSSWILRRSIRADTTEFDGHSLPLVAVFHNQPFDRIVSIDVHGVLLWEPHNGRKLGQYAFFDRLAGRQENDVSGGGGFYSSFPVTAVACDVPHMRRLVVGTSAGELAVLNVASGLVLQRLTLPNTRLSSDLTIQPAAPPLSCQRKPAIPTSAKKVVSHASQVKLVAHLCFSARRLFAAVVGSTPARLVFWPDTDAAVQAPIAVVPLGNTSLVTTMTAVPPQSLVLGTAEGDLRAINTATFKPFTFLSHLPSDGDSLPLGVEGVVYSSQRDCIITVLGEDTVRFYSMKPGAFVGGVKILAASQNMLMNISLSEEVERYLVVADDVGNVYILDLACIPTAVVTRDPRQFSAITLVCQFRAAHCGIISTTYVPTHEMVLVGSSDSAVSWWTLNGVRKGSFGCDNWGKESQSEPTAPNGHPEDTQRKQTSDKLSFEFVSSIKLRGVFGSFAECAEPESVPLPAVGASQPVSLTVLPSSAAGHSSFAVPEVLTRRISMESGAICLNGFHPEPEHIVSATDTNSAPTVAAPTVAPSSPQSLSEPCAPPPGVIAGTVGCLTSSLLSPLELPKALGTASSRRQPKIGKRASTAHSSRKVFTQTGLPAATHHYSAGMQALPILRDIAPIEAPMEAASVKAVPRTTVHADSSSALSSPLAAPANDIAEELSAFSLRELGDLSARVFTRMASSRSASSVPLRSSLPLPVVARGLTADPLVGSAERTRVILMRHAPVLSKR